MVKKKVVDKKKASENKCNCKISTCLISLVLMVIGFYLLVMGFTFQLMFPGVWFNWQALLIYLVGFFLLGTARHLKMKAYPCEVK